MIKNELPPFCVAYHLELGYRQLVLLCQIPIYYMPYPVSGQGEPNLAL